MVTSLGLPMSLSFRSNWGLKYSSSVIAVGLFVVAYSVVRSCRRKGGSSPEGKGREEKRKEKGRETEQHRMLQPWRHEGEGDRLGKLLLTPSSPCYGRSQGLGDDERGRTGRPGKATA